MPGQIIRAAKHVLAPRGLPACTAREVAAAGPLTKSAIHYYFADMDVLIDRAMAEHVANFEANLRSAGAASSDPLASFWNIIDAYLATFRDHPQVTYLWLEYWIDAARKGRTATIAQLNQRITTVLAERLQAAGVPAPPRPPTRSSSSSSARSRIRPSTTGQRRTGSAST